MKKLFFTLLTVMLATLAAQAATDYGFSVAGTTVTSDNCNNITSSYITSGTVSYNPSSNTLFMHNVTINMTGSYNRVINNLECSDLTIMFRGTCNLTAQDAAAIRIRKTTNLMAPEATDVVNINGINDVGIWMATTNDYELWIIGPGKFNISSTKKPAIEDEDNSSGATQLDRPHYVYFDHVNAVLKSSQDNVCRRFPIKFKAGSSVRFKATNNSSKPIINFCSFGYEGNETLLEPYGAYYSNSNVYDSSGNKVYNKDIYVSDDYVAILNSTYFPDTNFRNILLSRYFSKGYITSTDVAGCRSLTLSVGDKISNLKGIEYFTNLTSLDCSNNLLTSLDLSHNTKLVNINCINNKLTSLNVSNMKSLMTLECGGNLLTSLYVSGCTALEELDCAVNNFTSLNINQLTNLKTLICAGNTSLTNLACNKNNLTTLNVGQCTKLTRLDCYENPSLTTITGLADCQAITYLDCEDCAITDLSALSNMTNIEKLYARYNKLTTLNLSNKSKLTYLRVLGNKQLTTLYCFSNALTTLDVTGCTALQTLSCHSNSNLATITGLGNCQALTLLQCSNCALTTLDGVNNMNNLTTLFCSNNKLTSLTVSGKSNLTGIYCTNNTQLTTLYCFSNALTTLDVTGCTALQTLSCHSNSNLATITGFADCQAMKLLQCSNCALTTLDGVNNMTNLTSLYCSNNKLTGTLRVNNKRNLEYLDCSNNKQLTGLVCNNNKLSTLTVTGCSALTSLNCAQNILTSLSVSGCDVLKWLYCYNNKISGSGMTLMVNSLPMRSESDRGVLCLLNIHGDNNVITDDQLVIAINKYWRALRGDDYDEYWEDITPSSGSVRGDVNGDKIVDVEDVNAAINITLRLNSASDYPGNADIDGSGIVDISDVNIIINITLKLDN